MTAVLQIGDRALSSEQIIPRLASYQMLPQLYRESIIDEAIAPISCTQAEIADACEQFYEQNQLIDEKARDLWLHHQGMNRDFLETVFIPRLLKIEKFKYQTWNHKLDTYFLQRKRSLDRAIYSLMRLRLNNAEIAREFYFRIQEREQSFAELARQYSQGPESQVDGIIGPIELGNLHPQVAQILAISKPGQLWHPIPIEGWLLIIRLERLIPAQLDVAMRQRLLRELFEKWVQSQLASIAQIQGEAYACRQATPTDINPEIYCRYYYPNASLLQVSTTATNNTISTVNLQPQIKADKRR